MAFGTTTNPQRRKRNESLRGIYETRETAKGRGLTKSGKLRPKNEN